MLCDKCNLLYIGVPMYGIGGKGQPPSAGPVYLLFTWTLFFCNSRVKWVYANM